jgi:anthranilate synthase component 2
MKGEGLRIRDEGLGGKDYEGISLEEDYIFCGLPDRIPVGRYHSWVVDTEDFPEALAITAMICPSGLKHREYDIHGIQFHPESVLTPDGKTIVKNWLFK